MVSRNKVNLDLEIPVTEREIEGAIVKTYEGYNYGWSTSEKNKIFRDTLTYTGFGKGRSSVKFYFVGLEGTEYEMFLKDFSELAKTTNVNIVSGEWAFCKRGSNYGLTKIID